MTSALVVDTLRWAAPPLLGALAGYGAATVIARVLLRRADPHGRRRSAALEARLEGAAESLIQRVLALPASHLVEMAGTAPSGDALGDAVRGILGSRTAIYAVREVIRRGVESLSRADMREALSRIDLDGAADRLLASVAVEPRRGALSRAVAEALVDNAPKLLDDTTLDGAAAIVESFAPTAVEHLVAWVKTPQTRAALSARGRELLPRILEKLNLVQRFLISAGQFDRRMTEKMPEIVDETISAIESFLRDPSQQRAIIAALRDALREWRSSLAGDGREKAVRDVDRIVAGLLGGLGDPSVRVRIAGIVRERILSSYPTAGALAREILGGGEAEIAERLSARALTLLTSEGTADAARALLGPVLEEPVEQILGIDVTRRKQLARRAVSGILDTLDERELARPLRWLRAGGAALGLVIGIVELFVGIVLPSR